jgi:drug/metabolite transporter (DMT)-like permease
MKLLGIILIIAGIAMFLVTGISYTTEETVIDAGPLQVSAENEESLNWPPYAGGIAVIAGFVLLALGKKK